MRPLTRDYQRTRSEPTFIFKGMSDVVPMVRGVESVRSQAEGVGTHDFVERT